MRTHVTSQLFARKMIEWCFFISHYFITDPQYTSSAYFRYVILKDIMCPGSTERIIYKQRADGHECYLQFVTLHQPCRGIRIRYKYRYLRIYYTYITHIVRIQVYILKTRLVHPWINTFHIC